MSERKIRILMSKPGIDGHWRGIVTVSRGMRDAGMEVIFGGFQSIDEIAEAAVQEDVDIIGLSIHSGAHTGYTKRLIAYLEKKGVKENFMILLGGAIPKIDFQPLKDMGVAGVYGPGTMIPDIIGFIHKNIKLKDVMV